MKNLKNEIFKLISLFIKKSENRDVIFDVFRVITVILTNDGKKNFKKISKFIYDFIVTLRQKNEFVKFRRDEFA